MPDPIDAILRIRRLTVDDARRGLAALLQAEGAANSRLKAAEALVIEEAEIAADLAGGDDRVEAFAAWLPVGRARTAAARADVEQLQLEVARGRAALVSARAAAESAENLLTRRAAQLSEGLARREQASMDEISAVRASK